MITARQFPDGGAKRIAAHVAAVWHAFDGLERPHVIDRPLSLYVVLPNAKGVGEALTQPLVLGWRYLLARQRNLIGYADLHRSGRKLQVNRMVGSAAAVPFLEAFTDFVEIHGRHRGELCVLRIPELGRSILWLNRMRPLYQMIDGDGSACGRRALAVKLARRASRIRSQEEPLGRTNP